MRRPSPKTYHVKTLPKEMVGRKVKRATVTLVKHPEKPATDDTEAVPAWERNETTYEDFFRIRLWGKQFRLLRRAGTELIPA